MKIKKKQSNNKKVNGMYFNSQCNYYWCRKWLFEFTTIAIVWLLMDTNFIMTMVDLENPSDYKRNGLMNPSAVTLCSPIIWKCVGWKSPLKSRKCYISNKSPTKHTGTSGDRTHDTGMLGQRSIKWDILQCSPMINKCHPIRTATTNTEAMGRLKTTRKWRQFAWFTLNMSARPLHN